ncbi:carbon starvation CstA family protein [Roseimaritima ulvae]|uniref:Inner membrane protein YjiY n=1 Tax=Roseimaritima ulvae TaxID=980254 RepID=A0A5B9QT03_9BACT|nr:carbon starvation protein A [Roseimaritima ulvae]QEG41069.1 Inner membrane protein YjiY [Roseimaritima ulvae]
MTTLLVAAASMIGFIVAYNTYGRWLAKKLFGLSKDNITPSHQLRDDVDYVPTRRSVIFGHHFTSIAGTGPIVGPALAVFWGWLPALLWVVFGSILIGGVHDLSALVISLRNRGQTIGETAGRLISPRAKLLFLIILAAALTIVLAVFGLVIATVFAIYPESVLSVWVAMPVAVVIGLWVYRRGGGLLAPSLLGLGILYAAVWLGAYYLPIDLANLFSPENHFWNPKVVWTIALLIYAFAASVLPVWLLLQPRDYINSQQLYIALGLLVLGLAVASFSGSADIVAAAPAIAETVPAGAPPMLPFLFITIACGACSGFHCLVSSGTTSKQVSCETDAQAVGYGAMLLEGALAVLVILACCAGVGMGPITRNNVDGVIQYEHAVAADGTAVTGRAAWGEYYRASGHWKDHNLGRKLAAFVDGGANFISTVGVPLQLAVAIMAVLVASFAATTLDTATRLQRYVIQELGSTLHIKPLTNRYVATLAAVGVAAVIAFTAGTAPGAGGMMLWPLFGATNQLLAGLALMVAFFYLTRRGKPLLVIGLPMVIMMLLPAWAMSYNLGYDWYREGNWLLVGFGVGILLLQVWMAVEGVILWRSAKGVLEPQLPALKVVPDPKA